MQCTKLKSFWMSQHVAKVRERAQCSKISLRELHRAENVNRCADHLSQKFVCMMKLLVCAKFITAVGRMAGLSSAAATFNLVR